MELTWCWCAVPVAAETCGSNCLAATNDGNPAAAAAGTGVAGMMASGAAGTSTGAAMGATVGAMGEVVEDMTGADAAQIAGVAAVAAGRALQRGARALLPGTGSGLAVAVVVLPCILHLTSMHLHPAMATSEAAQCSVCAVQQVRRC